MYLAALTRHNTIVNLVHYFGLVPAFACLPIFGIGLMSTQVRLFLLAATVHIRWTVERNLHYKVNPSNLFSRRVAYIACAVAISRPPVTIAAVLMWIGWELCSMVAVTQTLRKYALAEHDQDGEGRNYFHGELEQAILIEKQGNFRGELMSKDVPRMPLCIP